MEIQQNEKDKKSKTYLMILIGALFALNVGIGINLWLGNKEKEELKTQNATLTNDKKVLQAELDKQIAELETMRSENQGLNEQLSEKDNVIEEKIKQIKSMLVKDKLNEELTTENVGLNESLTTEQARSAEKDKAIESQKKTISIAKRLHASSISAAPVRERKMFGKKEVETDKANKVEEIRVKFTIDKNSISDAGDKDLYVKIIGPDGSPITTKMQTTKVDGTETLYTERKTIDYQNEKQDNVVYCKKQGVYPKGEYTVEIFTEGYKIGTSKFILR